MNNKRLFLSGRRPVCILMVLLMAAVMTVPSMALEDTNGGTAYGVTDEMCRAGYWKNAAARDPAQLQMTLDEIRKANQKLIDSKTSSVRDMVSDSSCANVNADNIRSNCAQLGDVNMSRAYYIDGVKIDNEKYFGEMREDILNTGYTGASVPVRLAVCVRHTEMRGIPTDDVIGYSAADADDEMESDALSVNEPFIIVQKCERKDGKVFYMGRSRTLSGWVNAEDLAICRDKAEWIDAWQVDTADRDFLVVTQDKITTEPSLKVEYSSKVTLTLGTILKLVPDDEIPTNIGERNTWHNFVVYLPVRKPDGTYEKQPALISQHYNVSIGFMPMTEANILDTAFTCLGNRYGWGNMLESMDCSGYIRSIYQCFGLFLPRNTTYQPGALPENNIDLKNMDDTLKKACLETLPAGTALYMPGHAMMLIGSVNNNNYVISSTGSVVPEGGSEVLSVYSVIINPLTITRKNGTTWRDNLETAVVYPDYKDISGCEAEVSESGGRNTISVRYGGQELKEGTDYNIRIDGNRAIIMGTGGYTGVSVIKGFSYCPRDSRCPMSSFSDLDMNEWYHNGIHECLEKGYMNGVDAGRFEPSGTLTRAQLVTIIWRMKDSPGVDYDMTFEDIPENIWYTEAVRWAASTGIVNGRDAAHFDPEGKILRQELASMIYRDAKERGLGYDGGREYRLRFSDADDIDPYALEAVTWCVEHQIINGLDDGRLDPKGTASRAQAAAMIQRYSDHLESADA